jgi:hypothetical protein
VAKKIVILGLPGAGKTTLARALAPLIEAVHFNADAVRAAISRDLGFALADRVEHARRMGWLCDQVVAAGHHAIADFVCPTAATRAAFGSAFTVFVDTIAAGRFADTNAMFEPPDRVDYLVQEKDAATHAARVRDALRGSALREDGGGFDWRKPTALFIGRYQPFHDGHRRLVLEGLARVGQACIAVRDTHGIDATNPFAFPAVAARIAEMMADQRERITVVQLPNVTHVFYGRDVGYAVERIELPADVERISATALRAAMARAPEAPSS